MPEVAGDAACFVDPLSVDSIRDGLERLMSDASYRAELRDRGLANARRFAAPAIAARYADVYREAAA